MSDNESSSSTLPQKSSHGNQHLTRTTIREANNHLQMLYARNQELEETIRKQNDDLNRKDVEMKKLSQTNELLERHCQQLQALIEDRTRRLYVYERKEIMFREAIELKPAIESLLDVLTTFEQVDQSLNHSSISLPTTSTQPINHKPLEFVPSSSKKKNIDPNNSIERS